MGMTVLGVLPISSAHLRTHLRSSWLLGSSPGSSWCRWNAMIQHRPAADRKGAIIAVSNLLRFLSASFLPPPFYTHYATSRILSPHRYFSMRIFALAATAYDCCPASAIALAVAAFFRDRAPSIASASTAGEHSAKAAPIFCFNHLSFVDALFVSGFYRSHSRSSCFRTSTIPAHQAVRKAHAGDSHSLLTWPARHDPLVAHCQRSIREGASSASLRRQPSPA